MPSSAHPLAYSPVHTSDAFMIPLWNSTSLMLSLVTTVGVNSSEGVS